MGLVSWLRDRAWQAGTLGRSRRIRAASRPDYRRTGMPAKRGTGAEATTESALAPASASTSFEDEWEELPPYLPVDPAEHATVCVVASAIAAGDHPQSVFTVERVSIVNPEYQLVTCIATALAAGDSPSSSFFVRRIYKQKSTEGSHAA